MRKWLLQCSPDVWDVFAWWEDQSGELDDWTIARHLNDIRVGDRFAFWIGGKEAGVYAIGRVERTPYPVTPSGGYWKRPPSAGAHAIDLRTEQYLFDRPIRKHVLAADPDFRTALILRMPRTPNPVALTDTEWAALVRHIRNSPLAARSRARGHLGAIVTERNLGTVKEATTVTPASVERVREYREAGLVNRYQRYLKRPLVVRSALLSDGERLVSDAYDSVDDRLLEAKASASRQDVRMAIGQLLDYRRHLAPKSHLAVLLPERPTPDIVELLRSLGIEVIHEQRSGVFRTV